MQTLTMFSIKPLWWTAAQNEFVTMWSSLLTVFVMTMGEVNYGDMFLPQSRETPFLWDANILLFIFLFIMPIVLVNLLEVFKNSFTAFLNTFVMALGEIEYVDNYWVLSREGPFVVDANILLFIFLFLMPIVLMNLMIGIAVGDIEKIQHSAYMRRIALQVDLLYQFENTMPKFLARRTYIRRATVKPNEGKRTVFDRLRRYLFGSVKNVQFIHADVKDKSQGMLDRMAEDVRQTQARQRHMHMMIQQQETLLQQIANKLEVNGPHFHAQELLSPGPQSDTGSMYDNLSALSAPPASSAAGGHHKRAKSIRDGSTERPKSIRI